jgi:mono/diheme cytochrome c family protein
VLIVALIGTALSFNNKALSSVVRDYYIDQNFSIESLKNLLEENASIDSVEALVQALPASYRKHYTMITKSQSLQGATTLEPRIILVGDRADSVPINPKLRTFMDQGPQSYQDALTLSIKANPKHRGARGTTEDRVEIMDFKDGVFTFFELSFREDAAGKRFQISEPNPPRCLSCHIGTQNPANPALASEASPRPIWRFRYPDWTDPSTDLFGDDKGTDGFKTGWPQHWAKRESDAKKGVPNRTNLFPLQSDNYDAQSLYYPTPSSNQHVDQKLEWQNAVRVAKLLATTPDFLRYQYAIYGAIKACPKIDEFLPPSVRAQHKQSSEKYAIATAAAIDERSNIMTRKQKRIIGAIRYLFEGRGLMINHFWTAFEPINNGSKAGDGPILYMEAAFSDRSENGSTLPYDQQTRYEKSLAFEQMYYGSEYGVSRFFPPADEIRRKASDREPLIDCNALKAASLAGFAEPLDQGPPKPPATIRRHSGKELPPQIKEIVQNHCLSCHNPNTKIGQVYGDFLDQKVIAENFITHTNPSASLLWERVSKKQMPPKGAAPLSSRQIATLKAWIYQGGPAAN